jgi:hypothetical protein
MVEKDIEEVEEDGEEANASDHPWAVATGGQENRDGVERGGNVARWEQEAVNGKGHQEGEADEEGEHDGRDGPYALVF